MSLEEEMKSTIEGASVFAPKRDRHAEALAFITETNERNAELANQLTETRIELARERDRYALLLAAHDRWRDDALVYRTKLVEIATLQGTINTLTAGAARLVDIVITLTEDRNALDAEIASLAARNKEQVVGAPVSDAPQVASPREGVHDPLPQADHGGVSS